jgi:hypothetical protein
LAKQIEPHLSAFGPRRLTRRDFVGEAALALGALPAAAYLRHLSDASWLTGMQNEAQKAAQASVHGTSLSVANGAISARWEVSATGLRLIRVDHRKAAQVIEGPRPSFIIALRGGDEIVSSSMKLIGSPRAETLGADAEAARFSERVGGRAVTATFEDMNARLRAEWKAILRDGSRYIRQELTLEAIKGDLPIDGITLIDLDAPGADVKGRVKGSPVTFGNWFAGFEHPLSESKVEGDRVLSNIERQLPLQHGRSETYSSVIGVSEKGQLRRDFLQYIERERAHPYRTFLHYNSWFDLGYFTPYDETEALDVINAFGHELRERRGVTLDSFLFDDGWDNHNSLWQFNSGFPHGFTPLKAAAGRFGAAPGIWLSPWGGYDGPRKERLAYGKLHGYEEDAEGFVLSGPRYYERFRAVCMEMVRKYGVNQFKFDGTANTSTVYSGSKFNSDFDAMISLIRDLRKTHKNLYVNLTSGTYPSPFWLRCADSTWRGGEDDSFAGVGSDRQQWITYRDAATYEHVARGGPLYPLNSLMLHGMIYARSAKRLDTDPGHDFADEVHSYFGTGTQLQEMYITHSLLSASDWDTLAEAANWSRRNADILVDTHWIGGDPANLEVYGWACWSPRGGIVTLRNPGKDQQSFEFDPQDAFELPDGAPERYVARIPWKGQDMRQVRFMSSHAHTFVLQPFEVLTMEALPR